MSLAVLFPGQGSIVPGAGRSWVDHPAGPSSPRSKRSPIARSRPGCSTRPADPRTPSPAPMPPSSPPSRCRWSPGRPSSPSLEEAPAAFAGHSLGQITALIAAGAVDRDEGIALAVARADACRASDDARPGRLAALLGATLEQAPRPACAATEACWIANDNAPGQVVIGGTPEGLAAADRGRPRARRPQGHAPRRRRCLPHPAAGTRRRARWRPTLAADHLRPTVGPDRRQHRRRRPAPAPTAGRRCSPATSSNRSAGARSSSSSVDDLGSPSVVELAPAGTLTAMAKRTIPEVDIRTLDELLQAVPADGRRGARTCTSGSCSRPSTGRFVADRRRAVDPATARRHSSSPARPSATSSAPGEATPVTTPFTGVLAGLLAHDGERVREGQPVAWLRVA